MRSLSAALETAHQQKETNMENETTHKITRDRGGGDITKVAELERRLGRHDAAAALGMTTSGLATSINRGTCSRTVSLLATRLLLNTERQSTKKYIVTVPADADAGFQSIVQAMNLRVMELDV